MPKLSLTKTIEATKLNKRTLSPEGGSDVQIPYGAIVDLSAEDHNSVTFTYLGEPYRCTLDLWNSATAKLPDASQGAASGSKSDAEAAAPETPKLVWQKVPSTIHATTRAKVPGGWLVAIEANGLAFYPDPNHSWDGTSLD